MTLCFAALHCFAIVPDRRNIEMTDTLGRPKHMKTRTAFGGPTFHDSRFGWE